MNNERRVRRKIDAFYKLLIFHTFKLHDDFQADALTVSQFMTIVIDYRQDQL